MNRFLRPLEPNVLHDNFQIWTKELLEGTVAGFSWRQKGNVKSEDEIRNALIEASKNHCNYCDSFPLGESSNQTIDHFKPKSKFPDLAYSWGNLYHACNVCQGAKLEKFHDKLLRPDDPDYSFERYFSCDMEKGELVKNAEATLDDQLRAEVTIEIFDLKRIETCKSRLRHRRWFKQALVGGNISPEAIIDDYPYRDFLLQ